MSALKEVLPRKGLLYQEDSTQLALCRPKLMPLKSVTLEKLEEMQQKIQEQYKEQQQPEGTPREWVYHYRVFNFYTLLFDEQKLIYPELINIY